MIDFFEGFIGMLEILTAGPKAWALLGVILVLGIAGGAAYRYINAEEICVKEADGAYQRCLKKGFGLVHTTKRREAACRAAFEKTARACYVH